MTDNTQTPPPPPPSGSSPLRRGIIFSLVVAVSLAVGATLGALGASDSGDRVATLESDLAEMTELRDNLQDQVDEADPEPDVPPVNNTPSEPPEDAGPKTFAVGEQGTYSEDGTEVGTVVIESVERTTKPQDEYSDPPAYGSFMTITVSATAKDGQLYDVSSFDFYVRNDAGQRWDQTSGNSYYLDTDLSSATLNGGETIRGTLTFDVPKDATEVVYAPGRRALGVWELPR